MATDVEQLKEYFKKLRAVVLTGADFNFFGSIFIKKNKIDDVLCCILATLPDIYKKGLRTNAAKKMTSMLAYNLLFKAIKQKCPFNSEVYMVNKQNAIRYISTIISSIERDLIYLEKNS